MADEPNVTLDPDDARPVVSTRTVEIVVSAVILALAIALGWENLRLGAAWAQEGPEAGYFPFYLSVLLGAASAWGLVKAVLAAPPPPGVEAVEGGKAAFVNRDQLVRVAQVFVPTFLYVLLIQFLGIYVASFLFVAGFMIGIGRAAVWKALLTGFLFTVFMFYVFEIQFTVIMPKGPLESALGF